jgi:hypothetical protein
MVTKQEVLEVFPADGSTPSYGLFIGEEKQVLEWVAKLAVGGFPGRLRIEKRTLIQVDAAALDELREAQTERDVASAKVRALCDLLTPRTGSPVPTEG